MNKLYILSVIIIALFSCSKKKDLKDVNFRTEMVNLVSEISDHAKAKNPNFLIIPQNGEALANELGFLDKTDGIGKEDFNYGYEKDGLLTPTADRNEMITYLDMFTANNQFVLAVDYVFASSEDIPEFGAATQAKIDDSYSKSTTKGYIPYATVRNLNYLTVNPNHEPLVDTINSISDIKSYLYYLQPNNLSKEEYITNISESNFDLVVMDFSYDGSEEFTSEDIQKIKSGLNNGNGGYVVAYMSIGEAEDYRYYWDENWSKSNGKLSNNAPDWIYSENKDWEGNFKVLYWNSEWKKLIYGDSSAYLDKIIAQGFDGVYLDIVDGYEFYEDIMGE